MSEQKLGFFDAQRNVNGKEDIVGVKSSTFVNWKAQNGTKQEQK